ncbi:hypothetical protein [Rhodoferax ferrireducens]|uniref:hypothetical protein n=1 Tax=Rhodoferax ferrireducens TaxID=192843 RepID=UPI000E0D678C|nr:hypothetical protein [Rhodoferax ferrireducens]
MNVIPPLAITDARLTSSTVVEVAPAAYAGGTTYALNATASVAGAAGLITVYKSLQAGNIGHAPASSPTWWVSIGDTYQVYAGATTYALADYVLDATAHLVYRSVVAGNVGQALTDTTKWQLIGPSNRHAMFDLKRNTATIVPGSLTVVLTTGVRVNSFMVSGMVANAAVVTVSSGGVTVYTRTYDLNTREVLDWYDYYFAPFSTQPSLIEFDLPPYTNAVITVTLSATSGNVECGACSIGTYEFIGDVEYDAESDVLNFSTVTRDFDGGTSVMVPRRNVPRTVQSIFVDKTRVNRVRALRDALGGEPAIYAGLIDSGDGYFESLLIVGFYKRFSISLKHPTKAIISLELEEV